MYNWKPWLLYIKQAYNDPECWRKEGKLAVGPRNPRNEVVNSLKFSVASYIKRYQSKQTFSLARGSAQFLPSYIVQYSLPNTVLGLSISINLIKKTKFHTETSIDQSNIVSHCNSFQVILGLCQVDSSDYHNYVNYKWNNEEFR